MRYVCFYLTIAMSWTALKWGQGIKCNVPECKSLAVPRSALVESFSLLCPIRSDWATRHRNPVEADAHRIHLKSPLLCRHAMWSNRQQHAFHFVHDAMNSCRRAFAAPSMWMPVARTDECQCHGCLHFIHVVFFCMFVCKHVCETNTSN